jgi:hypothetical protein
LFRGRVALEGFDIGFYEFDWERIRKGCPIQLEGRIDFVLATGFR